MRSKKSIFSDSIFLPEAGDQVDEEAAVFDERHYSSGPNGNFLQLSNTKELVAKYAGSNGGGGLFEVGTHERMMAARKHGGGGGGRDSGCVSV